MNQYQKGEEPQNLMSGVFDTQDGHGGRAEEHRQEMENVARTVCAEELAHFESRMYEIAYQAYQQAIEDVLRALEYDIESVTRIGIDGCRDIFEDKKAQKFISDHIMRELQKQLNGKGFRK